MKFEIFESGKTRTAQVRAVNIQETNPLQGTHGRALKTVHYYIGDCDVKNSKCRAPGNRVLRSILTIIVPSGNEKIVFRLNEFRKWHIVFGHILLL